MEYAYTRGKTKVKMKIGITRRLAVFALAALAGFAGFAAEFAPVDWSSAETIDEGIVAISLSFDSPRMMKAVAARVDLATSNFFFSATGRAERWGKPVPGCPSATARTRRATTEDFLLASRAPASIGGRELDMLLAFNTSPWTPFSDPLPYEYANPSGICISEGVEISLNEDGKSANGYFVVGRDGSVDILPSPLKNDVLSNAWIAHSGFDIVLRKGKPLFKPGKGSLNPRLVLGLSQDRRFFFVLAVEGRHPFSSLGADYADIAGMMLSLGANDAINMDGGGSTSLVSWDKTNKRQKTLFTQNNPVRRVALNLGLCKRGSKAEAPADDERLYESAMAVDPTRLCTLFHRFEFNDIHDTPPPDGYKPIYVSHYGRHGSRRHGDYSPLSPIKKLEAADKAGILTKTGKEFLKRAHAIAKEHEDMAGELTGRGAFEHRTIARRIFQRVPEVFKDGGFVRCKSSTVRRCIISMANFALSLKESAPLLDFSMVTSEKFMRFLASPADREFKAQSEVRHEIVGNMTKEIDPTAFEWRLFNDRSKAREITGDMHRFMYKAYRLAEISESLGYELDDLSLMDFFSRDEALALSKAESVNWYLDFAGSEELGHHLVPGSARLANDIVVCADEALASGGKIRADFRFGHDQGLWPLAAYLGLADAGVRCKGIDSWKLCPVWRYMTMAQNIQLIFYANDTGDILVKIVFGERETEIKGLTPVNGPYYRWKDLRQHIKREQQG